MLTFCYSIALAILVSQGGAASARTVVHWKLTFAPFVVRWVKLALSWDSGPSPQRQP
jgi:hypothetical protein